MSVNHNTVPDIISKVIALASFYKQIDANRNTKEPITTNNRLRYLAYAKTIMTSPAVGAHATEYDVVTAALSMVVLHGSVDSPSPTTRPDLCFAFMHNRSAIMLSH